MPSPKGRSHDGGSRVLHERTREPYCSQGLCSRKGGEIFAIDNLIRLQYNLVGPDDVDLLLNNEANIPVITHAICLSHGTHWTMVKEAPAHFPLKDPHHHIKV